jgi:hypothetical protein
VAATPQARRQVAWVRVQGGFKLSLKLQIELVYDPGCPNVGRARDVLTAACREVHVPAVWTEWNSEDPTWGRRRFW